MAPGLQITRIRWLHNPDRSIKQRGAGDKPAKTRGSLIVGFPSQEMQRRALRGGLVIEAQLFETRPFEQALIVTQCFKCQRWGHTQTAWRPCKRARTDWSPQASELLAGVRRARRRHTAFQFPEDRQEYKRLSNCLKREIRRTARANWRRLIEELTNDQKLPYNKGLWRLSRWSRRVAGKPHTDPHIPALRRHDEEASTEKDEERAKILAEKFFPQTPQVHRRRHALETQARSPILVEMKVTQEEIATIIRALPTGKAPGPDRIPNEILKILVEEISEGLAQGVSMLLAAGTLPRSLKESTKIALRKEGKKDYSLPSSYRPIALENTLAKVVEKVLHRLSNAAEKHTLLPWAQMGHEKSGRHSQR